MSHLLQGLAPVVDARTRLLVLGSFPGGRSLQLRQYYAHPQNQFWRILQAIWPQAGWPADGDYAQRCACALDCGVGVWDVYAQCEREGSLDSEIRSARLNDFAGLFAQCPQLVGIAHNGGESHRHARAVWHALQTLQASPRQAQVKIHRLPSSSPAHASWTFERKLNAWRAVMQEHGLV